MYKYQMITILSPLSTFVDLDLQKEWHLEEYQQESLEQSYEEQADAIFEMTALEALSELTQKKLAYLGINEATVSVYITEKKSQALRAEDIIIEVDLPIEAKDRHEEICKYLEYELGTTIRIGYTK